MFRHSWKKSVAILFLASPLFLGACASSDDVKRAQATADEALTTARQALQQSQIANQKADKAISDSASANAKADRMFQQGLKK
jgi:PBP1b-binding outer membrane lipoprotein LpoB